jgi:hypothetical protein
LDDKVRFSICDCTLGIQSFNGNVNCPNSYTLFALRTNDYTEFLTCTHCNPTITDNYDSLNTTIGMYWCLPRLAIYYYESVFDENIIFLHK